jgi:hypothetical protein
MVIECSVQIIMKLENFTSIIHRSDKKPLVPRVVLQRMLLESAVRCKIFSTLKMFSNGKHDAFH